MKQLSILAVSLYIIGMAVMGKAESVLESICKAIQGGKSSCTVSKWTCDSSSKCEEQTMKVTYSGGKWEGTTHVRCPCSSSPNKACKNTLSKKRCSIWRRIGDCTKHAAASKKFCCRTCRGSTNPVAASTKAPTIAPACRNTWAMHRCIIWRRTGGCTSNVAASKELCCRTCRGSTNPVAEECPRENGYVYRAVAVGGVTKLDWLNGNTLERQASCLAKCRAHARSTGCLLVWNRGNKGCYAYTTVTVVDNGNGADNYFSWIFSKCRASTTTTTTTTPAPASTEALSTAPVDGGWGKWSQWTECSKTCDGGMKGKVRKCNSPAPTNGGRMCSGQSKQSISCNQQVCAKGLQA